MVKLFTLLWLILSSAIAMSQSLQQSRFLSADYHPLPLEVALVTLTATNKIGSTAIVEYKARQSVIFQPGFEAKAGAVFIASTGVVAESNLIGEATNSLRFQLFPNPFEETVTISYELASPAKISLQITDVDGRPIHRLVDSQYQEAGHYAVRWTENKLSAGTYLCSLDVDSKRLTKRIIRK